MKQLTHPKFAPRLYAVTLLVVLTLAVSHTSYAQELSVDNLPGDWSLAATWDASGNWDVGGAPTSGVNRWATIRGDISIAGSLDYSHTTFSEGLTIESNDTLTIFGDLTFTGAIMTLDVQDNGVLKVYGDLDTNGSTVSLVGDGVIVISGDLIVDGGSIYTDNAGGDDLYVNGSTTGTANGGDFTDLNSNHPVLYSEVSSELPVVLLDFTARALDHQVELNWTTASEENFDHFEVQRSYDGAEFSGIGYVTGHGNSNIVLHYQYSDYSATGSTLYYRLMAVDYDGSYEIFESVRVEMLDAGGGVVVYPNPVQQSENQLAVEISKDLNPSQIEVLDPSGRVLIQEHFIAPVTMWRLNQSLAKGIYHIRIYTASRVLAKRFLVN
ncbi:MAG: T9SS type A sorting domain-containing protein [Reichenbachiella sp.]|uniref:T9SS type A sorting domain-containing protein n=1 Tax=Reichenbachiella sp. TaxID=2184521 RepID=UPI0032641EBD